LPARDGKCASAFPRSYPLGFGAALTTAYERNVLPFGQHTLMEDSLSGPGDNLPDLVRMLLEPAAVAEDLWADANLTSVVIYLAENKWCVVDRDIRKLIVATCRAK